VQELSKFQIFQQPLVSEVSEGHQNFDVPTQIFTSSAKSHHCHLDI